MRILLAPMLLLALAGCHQKDRAQAAETGNANRATQIQSFEKGPRYESTIALADGEELSILLIPDRYTDLADQRCMVYKNAKIGAVSVQCPNGVEYPDFDEPLGNDCTSSRYGDC